MGFLESGFLAMSAEEHAQIQAQFDEWPTEPSGARGDRSVRPRPGRGPCPGAHGSARGRESSRGRFCRRWARRSRGVAARA